MLAHISGRPDRQSVCQESGVYQNLTTKAKSMSRGPICWKAPQYAPAGGGDSFSTPEHNADRSSRGAFQNSVSSVSRHSSHHGPDLVKETIEVDVHAFPAIRVNQKVLSVPISQADHVPDARPYRGRPVHPRCSTKDGRFGCGTSIGFGVRVGGKLMIFFLAVLVRYIIINSCQ